MGVGSDRCWPRVAAAAATLRESPAALMLPRAAQARASASCLERIRPVWSPPVLLAGRSPARNLFRYKRRLVMTVVGVAGCTALLLTGLGLHDSINDIVDKQYGEIYHFNTIVRMDSRSQPGRQGQPGRGGGRRNRRVHVGVHGQRYRSRARHGHRTSRGVRGGPEDAAALQQFVTMRTRVGQTPLQLDGEGAIISEKLASQLGVSVGDTVQLYDEDDIGNLVGQPHDVRVAGIMENYVSQYVYVTAQVYQDMMGQEPSFSTVYASLPDGADRDAFSDDTLALDDVKTVTYNDETIDSYRTMLKTVDSVVVVLVVAAALLAFVVLYNLTNINITERAREIATLKVLGFTPREVDAYIFRETMLLSVIGAVVGMLLGVVMEGFVITTAEVDQVMFGRDIHAVSFVIAFALTLLFSLIVAVAMRKKLRRINMVESLKSNE